MHITKLTQIGNLAEAIFPKELLAQMWLEKGDDFYVPEKPDGLRITTRNPEFKEQMKLGREIMKKRCAMLRASPWWSQSYFYS